MTNIAKEDSDDIPQTFTIADLMAAMSFARATARPAQGRASSPINTPGIAPGNDTLVAASTPATPAAPHIIHMECTACDGKGYIVASSAHNPTSGRPRPRSGSDGSAGFTLPTRASPASPTAEALGLALAAVAPPCDPMVYSNKWYCVTVGRRVGVFPDWTVAASHTSRVPGGTVVMRATRGAAEHAFNSARALGTVKVVLPSGQTVSVPPEDML